MLAHFMPTLLPMHLWPMANTRGRVYLLYGKGIYPYLSTFGNTTTANYGKH